MSDQFPSTTDEIPDLSREQMVEVDRAMVEDHGIGLIQMMENAGRNLAHLARQRFLGGDPRGRHVAVLAGRGGNGGGALVCARRLSNWGASVEILLTAAPAAFSGVPAHQLNILTLMQQLTISAPEDPKFPSAPGKLDLVIDGVIGYSLSGAPHGPAAEMIRWANDQPAPVLALDVPSGLDVGQGQVLDPAIHATATLTLALPKRGLRSRRREIGELYLADIGIPPVLFERALGLKVGPLFAESDIIRLE